MDTVLDVTIDTVLNVTGSTDEESSLECFVRKIEAEQKDAIDAALDSTGNSEECAVRLVEEACWGCEETA